MYDSNHPWYMSMYIIVIDQKGDPLLIDGKNIFDKKNDITNPKCESSPTIASNSQQQWLSHVDPPFLKICQDKPHIHHQRVLASPNKTCCETPQAVWRNSCTTSIFSPQNSPSLFGTWNSLATDLWSVMNSSSWCYNPDRL